MGDGTPFIASMGQLERLNAEIHRLRKIIEARDKKIESLGSELEYRDFMIGELKSIVANK